jgi:hypothetical protein
VREVGLGGRRVDDEELERDRDREREGERRLSL